MKNTQIVIDRTILADLDKIKTLIVGCNIFSEDIKTTHSALSDSLLLNVAKLNLDENITNLMRFAVGIAVEISPFLSEMHSHVNENHWGWKPVIVKIEGKNRAWSDVRSSEKQAACMIAVLTHQLKRDQIFHNGALAIESYQIQSGIWSDAEFPDIDE